jgi:hypothetical protein
MSSTRKTCARKESGHIPSKPIVGVVSCSLKQKIKPPLQRNMQQNIYVMINVGRATRLEKADLRAVVSIKTLPTAAAAAIASDMSITIRDVLGFRGRRRRLNLSKSSESGKSAMTVNQERPNLPEISRPV